MCENFRAVIIQRARNYFFNHKILLQSLLYLFFKTYKKRFHK
ncbi:hypothetical protein HMPREF1443_01715 [Helicobacter pylori HP250BFi]|nr:hypothetical protein HMPREF1443_01715 [Helicobacter pylori HP250BFi]